MCGIVGYVGARQASDILLGGLTRLEYRGYDSAGVAVQNGRGLEIRKTAGRVERLKSLMAEQPIRGTVGIGHTRWATHGPPTTVNAHPHTSRSGEIALVHNGIVENASALKAHLAREGYVFETSTDTEVLVHLVADSVGDTLEEKVSTALSRVEGTYGIVVMSSAEPNKLVVARRGSPVLLGIGVNDDFFVASDPSAVVDHTRSVVYLEDGDIAVLTKDGYSIVDLEGTGQNRSTDDIDWDLESIELGGYPHFMLKEIFEQAKSVENTLRGRLLPDLGTARLNGLNLTPQICSRIRRVVIVGCGTSWHAGLVGRHLLEQLASVPVQVEYASEFRYQTQLPLDDALVVAISQSGETADTLEALRAAQAAGARVVGVVNVVGSSIARLADGGIYLHAGPEIGVASTKAFTCQLTALMLLGLYLGRQRGMTLEEGQTVVEEIARLPELLEEAFLIEPAVRDLAERYAEERNFLYLGRGVSFPVALEGALKLKEVSYVHAEGYPAAELKHGPIALIDDRMPAVFVAPVDEVYSKVVSNIQEVKARGGRTIVLTTTGNGELHDIADHQLKLPESPNLLSPFVMVVPLQLLAYHMAVLRRCDVDRPRNLAKSVTVE